MSECDCLHEFDTSFDHAPMCQLGDSSQPSDPLRELAEMAAYRDVSTAIMAYRQVKEVGR